MIRNKISYTFGSLLRLIALMRSARRDSIWWRPMRGTTSFPSTTEVIKLLVYCTAGMLNNDIPINTVFECKVLFHLIFWFGITLKFFNSKFTGKFTSWYRKVQILFLILKTVVCKYGHIQYMYINMFWNVYLSFVQTKKCKLPLQENFWED